jgi:hypothetical protein
MENLEKYLVPTQEALFKSLLAKHKNNVASFYKRNYILVQGEAPVMLVAHLDTVHREPVKHICKSEDGNILMSPQGIGGDDRCGVYALNAVYECSSVKPWLLFTCEEEVGGLGASTFCKKHFAGKLPKELEGLKMIIEIDRKGENDAVYYDCDNKDFEAFITEKGFQTQIGSFSDISYVAPELGVAAVNLSSGYYNAHTQHEYINLSQLEAVVKKVVDIVSEATAPSFPKYEYVEQVRMFGRFKQGVWDDWDYLDGYGYGFPATEKKQAKDLYDDWGVPLNLSKDYWDAYYELLEYYSNEYLDAMREKFGDSVLVDIYYATFEDEKEEDEEGKIVPVKEGSK